MKERNKLHLVTQVKSSNLSGPLVKNVENFAAGVGLKFFGQLLHLGQKDSSLLSLQSIRTNDDEWILGRGETLEMSCKTYYCLQTLAKSDLPARTSSIAEALLPRCA